MSRILLSLILIFNLNYSFSQSNLRFTHYTTREGLSNNIITSLFQDSRGLLWIGTSNGLNYFDGVSFQTIYPTDFDKVHLHSDVITRIAEDAGKKMLLSTDDGIEEYNWNAKTLQLIFPKTLNGGVNDFEVDKNKNIWLLGKNYLQEYSFQFKLVNKIRVDTLENKADKSGSFLASFFCVDNIGNIWFHYHEITCEWDVITHTLENKFNNPSHKKIFETNASDVIQDLNGNYWITINNFGTTANALGCYYPKLDSIQFYLSGNNQLLYLALSSAEKIWGTSLHHGLFILDKVHHRFQILHHSNSNVNSPVDDYFNAIYIDKNENVWLASQIGLDKCTDLSNSFTVLDNFGYDDPKTRYTQASIGYIKPYKKDLFVGTTAGFFKINAEDFHQQHFRFNQKKYVLNDNYWISTFIKNNLLLTSSWKGIHIYETTNKELHPLSFSIKHPKLLDSVPIVSEFKDCKNNLWLALLADNGIYCWNATNTFVKYDQHQTGKNYFPLRHFTCAAEDDDGNIWMGYDKGGLTIFDTASQKFIQPSFNSFTQLNKNAIHDILNDHHGNLWISTAGGLFCYALKTHQLKQYNRTDGLISNIVMGMAFDKNGVLWLGTYSGLSRFDTSTKQFINFTPADGLPDENIDQVIYDSTINKICFTTRYAVVLVDPYHLTKNIPALIPVITSFNVTGNQRSLNNSTKVNLSYKENFFSFNYTAADFVNTADVRYQYKLEGFNKNWINAGTRQYADYTNLNGGNYTFKLRANR